jgi:hypothetical protein
MLGRKTYTQEELDHGKAVIAQQLAAYQALVKAVGSKADKKADTALAAFEPLFFNNLILALDRPYVHRVRPVTGKDGNPLNEVEMICDALMNNNGVLRPSTVLKLVPDDSVAKIQFGETIRLTADQFERLSTAFFDELERKFSEA